MHKKIRFLACKIVLSVDLIGVTTGLAILVRLLSDSIHTTFFVGSENEVDSNGFRCRVCINSLKQHPLGNGFNSSLQVAIFTQNDLNTSSTAVKLCSLNKQAPTLQNNQTKRNTNIYH